MIAGLRYEIGVKRRFGWPRALEHADADAAIHLIVEAEAWHVGQNILAGAGPRGEGAERLIRVLSPTLDTNS